MLKCIWEIKGFFWGCVMPGDRTLFSLVFASIYFREVLMLFPQNRAKNFDSRYFIIIILTVSHCFSSLLTYVRPLVPNNNCLRYYSHCFSLFLIPSHIRDRWCQTTIASNMVCRFSHPFSPFITKTVVFFTFPTKMLMAGFKGPKNPWHFTFQPHEQKARHHQCCCA